jgi:hypothetical protein
MANGEENTKSVSTNGLKGVGDYHDKIIKQ